MMHSAHDQGWEGSLHLLLSTHHVLRSLPTPSPSQWKSASEVKIAFIIAQNERM